MGFPNEVRILSPPLKYTYYLERNVYGIAISQYHVVAYSVEADAFVNQHIRGWR